VWVWLLVTVGVGIVEDAFKTNVLVCIPLMHHDEAMQDFAAWRKQTIRYWERRRIAYNLVLVPPSLFTWAIAGGISAGVGDQRYLTTGDVLLLFVLCAVGANICYSLVYTLEFVFGSDDPQTRWNSYGRTIIFVFGTLFSIGLAAIGGRNIAFSEYAPNRFW
jgi:hypothetical protein